MRSGDPLPDARAGPALDEGAKLPSKARAAPAWQRLLGGPLLQSLSIFGDCQRQPVALLTAVNKGGCAANWLPVVCA